MRRLICFRELSNFGSKYAEMFQYGDIDQHVSSHVETIVLLSHKSSDSVINVTVEFGEGEGKVP